MVKGVKINLSFEQVINTNNPKNAKRKRSKSSKTEKQPVNKKLQPLREKESGLATSQTSQGQEMKAVGQNVEEVVTKPKQQTFPTSRKGRKRRKGSSSKAKKPVKPFSNGTQPKSNEVLQTINKEGERSNRYDFK